MKYVRVFVRSATAGLLAAMALVASCAHEEDTSGLVTALAAARITEDARSYDAMPLVPAALATRKDLRGSSSIQAVANDAVPQGRSTDSLKQIFTPVRASVLIGKELVQFGGELITDVEGLLARYPGLLGMAGVAYTDNADTEHPGHIAKLTSSATFGSDGRKVEIWWSDTGGLDPLRDGVKMLELDYRIDSSTGAIDGVLFFRHLPPERTDEFSLVRLEFRKAVSGEDITRTAYVYVENHVDFKDNSDANAAFFITENADGIVVVEGGYTVQGLFMPFQDANVALSDWESTDQRVYLFNGAGSITTGKAVVNVVLPLVTQSSALESALAPFANGQPWSPGELFTDGLLYYLQNNSETYGEFGTQTLLWFLNLISGATLTGDSTQEDLIAALDSIDVDAWGAEAKQIVADLKIITGIQNPVYFEKAEFSINLVGQLDTDGLDGAAEYDQLQGLLPADFAWFTMEGLVDLDIASGEEVDLISGHTGIEAWTGINAAAPSL